ncbi:MAG: membrane protein of unknown function [Promethearchaeota archaeon]|nr:MAG: membrane protein of unknown function [Candidatus Lokiarchaeota archaeon]
MNVKNKNRIVFSIQLVNFMILYLIIAFIEINGLYDLYTGGWEEIPFFTRVTTIAVNWEIFISNFFIYFMFVNQFTAGFSVFGFIFKLRILEKDSIKTIPVCAISTDIAMLNIFQLHFALYRQQYYAYFSIFPNLSSLIPEILSLLQFPELILTITFLSMMMNFYYGIASIKLGREYDWAHSFITVFFHVIMLINGVIALLSIISYLNLYTIELYSFILGFIFSMVFFLLFLHLLNKKQLKYPYEAIYKYRIHRKNKQKEKGKEKE